MPKSKLLPILEALFTVIIWGASFIATKVVKDDMAILLQARGHRDLV